VRQRELRDDIEQSPPSPSEATTAPGRASAVSPIDALVNQAAAAVTSRGWGPLGLDIVSARRSSRACARLPAAPSSASSSGGDPSPAPPPAPSLPSPSTRASVRAWDRATAAAPPLPPSSVPACPHIVRRSSGSRRPTADSTHARAPAGPPARPGSSLCPTRATVSGASPDAQASRAAAVSSAASSAARAKQPARAASRETLPVKGQQSCSGSSSTRRATWGEARSNRSTTIRATSANRRARSACSNLRLHLDTRISNDTTRARPGRVLAPTKAAAARPSARATAGPCSRRVDFCRRTASAAAPARASRARSGCLALDDSVMMWSEALSSRGGVRAVAGLSGRGGKSGWERPAAGPVGQPRGQPVSSTTRGRKLRSSEAAEGRATGRRYAAPRCRRDTLP